MKQTHHIGYVQTPSVKNLSNVKNALVENGLVSLTTPNEMLPDAIEKGLKAYNKDFGMIYENKYRIRYFDIDGKILKIEYVENGGKLTPPEEPNYDPDYLIFDEWNYDIENYVVEQPTDVGATYKPVDNITYFFIKLYATATITLALTNYTSIDWGDGTINTSASHTYAEGGEYIIKVSGNYTVNTSSSNYLLGSSNNNKYLTKAYLSITGPTGTHQSSFASMFYTCSGLEVVSLINGSRVLSSFVFEECYSLKAIVVPKSIKEIGTSFAKKCYALKVVSLPLALTTLKDTVFYYCQTLPSLILPKNLTTSGDLLAGQCTALKEVYIPKNLTLLNRTFNNAFSCPSYKIFSNTVNIASSTFQNNYGLKDLFIYSSSVISLSSNVFPNCPLMTIWVNDDIIEDLKVATNWSTYADRMKPLSWYPSLTDPNAE